MTTGGRSHSIPAHAPITDVSLFVLLDDAAVSTIAAAFRPVAPALETEVHRLNRTFPGPHVTLYEFIHVPGHRALRDALRWTERFGLAAVDRVAHLGPARFEARAIRQSGDTVVVMLDLNSPKDWLRRVVDECSAIEPGLSLRGRACPEPLHLTITRKPVRGSDALARSAEHPVDFMFSFDQFALALARQLPYGRVGSC
jgi:hypothetical protein